MIKNENHDIAFSLFFCIYTPSLNIPIEFNTSLLYLRPILLPLPNKETQTKIVRLEGNLTPLGEEEHIAFFRLDFLARLVADIKVAVDDNLNLIVRVRVHERCSLFQAVEATADGLVGVGGFAGGGVSRRTDRRKDEGEDRREGGAYDDTTSPR